MTLQIINQDFGLCLVKKSENKETGFVFFL